MVAVQIAAIQVGDAWASRGPGAGEEQSGVGGAAAGEYGVALALSEGAR